MTVILVCVCIIKIKACPECVRDILLNIKTPLHIKKNREQKFKQQLIEQ